MTFIALAIFVTLGAIAALHVAWGFGLRWPARNERGLVALVIGATGHTAMPPLPQCLTAGAAIFAAGVVALLVGGAAAMPLPPVLVTAAGVVVMLIFAGRGVAAYTPVWRRRFSQQPFARLDQTAYGPLCFVIALGLAVLLAGRG